MDVKKDLSVVQLFIPKTKIAEVLDPATHTKARTPK